MNQTYTWIRGLFKSEYHIYSGQKKVGNMYNKTFSQSGLGELNGKKYRFISSGFIQPKTEIIDENTQTKIGNIIYNSWMNKAQINYWDKTANWSYENILNTKWGIFDSNGNHIKYQGHELKGTIDSPIDDDLLILTGLFVTNYYWQMTIGVIITIFIPLWIVIF